MLLSWFMTTVHAQLPYRDSLRTLLVQAKDDTTRVNVLAQLSGSYVNVNPDSIFLYGQQGLRLAQSIGYTKGEITCKDALALYWWAVGDYATAIKLSHEVLDYAKKAKDAIKELVTYARVASFYRDQGDNKEGLQYSGQMIELAQKLSNCFYCNISYAIKGSVYYEMNKTDSALFYLTKALDYPSGFPNGWILLMNGRVQANLRNNKK